jgi:hypothetical protein
LPVAVALQILLFLIFYLFAIVSVIVFRDNDPVHFGSLHIALVTLFRMSTMEDWTDIMYINMMGCLQYGYIDGDYCYDSNNCDINALCSVESGLSKGYGAAAIFFIVFVVISGLVVMSLFIGVITSSMVMATMDAAEDRKGEQMKANREAMVLSLQIPETHGGLADGKQTGGSMKLLHAGEMDGLDEDEDDDTTTEHHGATGLLGAYLSLGQAADNLISANWFQNFIIGCIVMAAVLIGMQTYDTQYGLRDTRRIFFTVADAIILYIFTFECAAKMFAQGRTPHRYFYNGWNSKSCNPTCCLQPRNCGFMHCVSD